MLRNGARMARGIFAVREAITVANDLAGPPYTDVMLNRAITMANVHSTRQFDMVDISKFIIDESYNETSIIDF